MVKFIEIDGKVGNEEFKEGEELILEEEGELEGEVEEGIDVIDESDVVEVTKDEL